MNESNPLCLTCANNNNGICKIGKMDMYAFRMIPPKYGGCGESAVKHVPLIPERTDSGEHRIPYSWS